MDIYNSERAESPNLIAKQYASLMLRIARGERAGLGDALMEVLPGWDQEIVGQWRGELELCHDRAELLQDNGKATEFLLDLPKELKTMASLCGSNQAVKHACVLMRLRDRLLPIKEKLQGDGRGDSV